MPEISLFYGIRVTMYYDDHNPSHFHAEYNGNEVCYSSRRVDACTVMNDTLAWDIGGNRDAGRCIDIDPDTLYELPYCKEQIA